MMARYIKVGLGTVLVALLGLFAWDLTFVVNSVEARGEVVDRRSNPGGMAGEHVVVDYEHPKDGESYRAPLVTGLTWTPDPGTQVAVRVHQEHPSVVKVDSPLSLYNHVLAPLGVAALGGGGLSVKLR
jgi:hypothetical protein